MGLLSSDRLHAQMAAYGYEHIDTPILDQAWLFQVKAGDQIIERLVTLEHGGRELALRPEFTAAAAYRYTQQATPVVRWLFDGPIFEDAPETQHGVRQKPSIGTELIGLAGVEADAEIIGLAVSGLAALGVESYQLVVGHVGLMRILLDQFDLDERSERFLLSERGALKTYGTQAVMARFQQAFGAMPVAATDSPVAELASHEPLLGALLASGSPSGTMGGRTREEIAHRLLEKQRRALRFDRITSASEFLEVWSHIQDTPEAAFATIASHTAGHSEAMRMTEDWRVTIDRLAEYGVNPHQIVIQPDLARTWDYYTGVVFELRSAAGTLLGAGGRYDELVRLIGGERDVPAVGFAYYMDAIERVREDAA